MALATYDDLKAAIGAWNMDRSDLPAADLIALAEARLNRDLRLRAMETEAALAATVGSRTIPLPAGFLEPIGLFIERASGRQALRFVPAGMETSAAAGEPLYWTVDGEELAFERPADQAYGLTLRMLERFALSDAAPTNWLLTNWPDAYLAAANIEAALYLLDDAQAARWQSRYAEVLTEINAKEHRARALATLGVDAALSARAMSTGSAFNIARGY